MDEKKKGLTYAEAGVDIDAGEREVELIKKSVQATYTRGVLGDLGGFGGLFRLKDELSEDPILVSGTDGVGTKLRLAIEMGIHALKETQWIPCSEKMPEDNTDVIVCFYSGTVTEMRYWGNGIFQGIYEHTAKTIVAWMPLPEPYKGE